MIQNTPSTSVIRIRTTLGELGSVFQPGMKPVGQSRVVWLAGLFFVVGAAVVVGKEVADANWLHLGVLVAVILALQWPIEVALGLYVFLVPFDSIAALGQGTSGTTVNWVLGAVAASALLGAGIFKKRIRWPSRSALWWALFLGWGIASTAWALQPSITIQFLSTATALVALYLLAVSWQINEKQLSVLTRFVIAGAFIASCFVIYQYLGGVVYKSGLGVETGRASLVLGNREANPNHLGTDLLLPFSLAMGWFLSARRKFEVFAAVIVAAAIAYTVFITMSRGSLLAVGVILAIFLFRLGLQRRMLIFAPAFLLIAVSMPHTFFERLQTAVATGGAGRLGIWQVGLVLLKRYGGLGAGLANFPVAYSDFAGHASSFVGYGRGAHDIYLEVGVELGIVGVLLMFAAFVSHFKALRALRAGREPVSLKALALECACWATLVNGIFDGGVWYKSFWLTWMLALMIVGLRPRAAVDHVR